MVVGARSSSSCYRALVGHKHGKEVQATHSWSRHSGTVVVEDDDERFVEVVYAQ